MLSQPIGLDKVVDFDNVREKSFDELIEQIAFAKDVILNSKKGFDEKDVVYVNYQKQHVNILDNLDNKIQLVEELNNYVIEAKKIYMDNKQKIISQVEVVNKEKNINVKNNNEILNNICGDNNRAIDENVKNLYLLESYYVNMLELSDTEDFNDLMIKKIVEKAIKVGESCYLNTPVLSWHLLESNKYYNAKDLHKAAQTSDKSGVFYSRSQGLHSANKIRNTSKNPDEKFKSLNKFGQKIKANLIIKDKIYKNPKVNVNVSEQSKDLHIIGAGNAELPVSDFAISSHTANERFGEISEKTKMRSFANSRYQEQLRDAILIHKNKAVKQLIDMSHNEKKYNSFIIGDNQIDAKYPCLIICFSDYDHSRENGGLPTGYAEFCTHLLIACINQQLMSLGGPLLERRQSFGFLTPTLTDVRSGLRLSLGLVPNQEWLNAVIKGIKRCDEILKHIPNDINIDEYEDKKNNIMTTIGHRIIQGVIETGTLDQIGQKIKNLHQSHEDLVKNQVKNKIIRIYEAYQNQDNNLTPKLQTPNNEYVKLYNECMRVYSIMYDDLAHIKHESHDIYLLESNKKINLKESTSEFIKIQDQLIIAGSENVSVSQFGDEDTSEEEIAMPGHEEAIKNFRSPYGMSALFAPMYALHEVENNQQIVYEFDKYVYYELSVCWNNELESNKFIKAENYRNGSFANTITNTTAATSTNKTSSNFSYSSILRGNIVNKNTVGNNRIYYIDINPCMTNFNEKLPSYYFANKLKQLTSRSENKNIPTVIVVDTTSTTSDQLKAILQEFDKQDQIPMLVTATSVLKHSELGIDAYSLGENKVYLSKSVKNDKEYVKLYQNYVECLKNITVGTESGYGRKMRRELRKAINSVAHSRESIFYNDANYNTDKVMEAFIMDLLINIEKSASTNTLNANFIEQCKEACGENAGYTQHMLGVYNAVFSNIFAAEFNKLLLSKPYASLTKSQFVAAGYMLLCDRMDGFQQSRSMQIQ